MSAEHEVRRLAELPEAYTELANHLYRIGAVKIDTVDGFRVKMHEEHPDAPRPFIYYDLRLIQGDVESRRSIVQVYDDMLSHHQYDFIAGIPVGATPLAAFVAQALEKPMLTPRIGKKDGQIDGMKPSDRGKVAILLDDVANDGESKPPVAAICRSAGLVVNDAVVIIDREQGAKAALLNHGITLHAGYTHTELMDQYVRERQVTEEDRRKIDARNREIGYYLGRLRH